MKESKNGKFWPHDSSNNTPVLQLQYQCLPFDDSRCSCDQYSSVGSTKGPASSYRRMMGGTCTCCTHLYKPSSLCPTCFRGGSLPEVEYEHLIGPNRCRRWLWVAGEKDYDRAFVIPARTSPAGITTWERGRRKNTGSRVHQKG